MKLNANKWYAQIISLPQKVIRLSWNVYYEEKGRGMQSAAVIWKSYVQLDPQNTTFFHLKYQLIYSHLFHLSVDSFNLLHQKKGKTNHFPQ